MTTAAKGTGDRPVLTAGVSLALLFAAVFTTGVTGSAGGGFGWGSTSAVTAGTDQNRAVVLAGGFGWGFTPLDGRPTSV